MYFVDNMNPPAIPQAIVAVLAPPSDCESVLGDLHEEYVRRSEWQGRSRADSWYWMQAIGSIPSLLSYSRERGSAGATLVTAFIVGVSIVAMLSANELIGDAIHRFYHSVSGSGAWPFFLAGWIDAAFFGAFIAALRRPHGVRLVLVSALILLCHKRLDKRKPRLCARVKQVGQFDKNGMRAFTSRARMVAMELA